MTEYRDAPIQSCNESLSVAIDMAEDATSNPPAAAPEQQPSVSSGTTSLTSQFQYGSVVWSTAERLLEYLGTVWRNVQREWNGLRLEYLSAVCRLHACRCIVGAICSFQESII